jgi:hypothetical protein
VAKADIAALLAVAAALMVGIGDVLEQQSAQSVTDKPVGTLALFGQLLRDRRWWAGSLVAGAGFGLQAAALGFGSVVLVQALSVTSLLFALVINAKVNHRRITRWQWIWAVLLAAAVAVVVTVGNPQAGSPRGSFKTWAVVAAIMGPALDQGRGRPARPRHPGIAPHAGVICVGGAGDRGHSMGAVGVSGRPANRVATCGHYLRAHRRIGARRHRAG